MNKEIEKQISERTSELEHAKIELKKKFIGIDDQIDKVIENISMWYIMPEFQFRPLIISLWGITGVGKTDLVRSLVDLLNFSDKFMEIQMDYKNYYFDTIESRMEDSDMNFYEPAILLLDEMQRYRSIDEEGRMITNQYYNDVWTLLSDGKFQNDSTRKAKALEILFEDRYENERNEEEFPNNSNNLNKRNKKQKNVSYTYRQGYWQSKMIKNLLNISISIEDIMKMSTEECSTLIETTVKNGKINNGKTYEKLLIFISGNMDEAYSFSDEVDSADIDADIFHEKSKKVNIVDIKKCLSKQFKPEQIARFGNNHVIYPSLSKDNYKEIIKKNAQRILDEIEKVHGIKIDLSKNIYDLMYRNGVFPAQGVRPIITTVNAVLGSNLSYFMYKGFISSVSSLHLDVEEDDMICMINGKKEKKKIDMDLDRIRKEKSMEEISLTIVHELGHALLYGILYGVAPEQIILNSTDSFNDGFTITGLSISNKKFMMNEMCVCLGGKIAEEIVFPDEIVSSGASFDLMCATNTAGKFIRRFGMDKFSSVIAKKESDDPREYNFNIDETNSMIEKMVEKQKKKAKKMLLKNIDIFKALVDFAMKKPDHSMSSLEFKDICMKNGLEIKIKNPDKMLEYGYENETNKFLNK